MTAVKSWVLPFHISTELGLTVILVIAGIAEDELEESVPVRQPKMVRTRSTVPTTPVIPSLTLRGMQLNKLFIDVPLMEKAVRLFQKIDVRAEHREPPDLHLIYYFFCQEPIIIFHSILY
jgi:hypothetical protein